MLPFLHIMLKKNCIKINLTCCILHGIIKFQITFVVHIIFPLYSVTIGDNLFSCSPKRTEKIQVESTVTGYRKQGMFRNSKSQQLTSKLYLS